MSADVTGHDKGPLLGRQVSGSATYDPSLLFPVPRGNARNSLPGGVFRGFGEDIWHAYELSWLRDDGLPVMYLGILGIPADSPRLIESKSLKLYLNSLNRHRFASEEEARQTIEADLGGVAGAPVALELLSVDDARFAGADAPGENLDHLSVPVPPAPDDGLIRPAGEGVLHCHTHRLRSLCPVTAQPDWATVVVKCEGTLPSRESLLAFLLSFATHQEFHEQCVERIFTALQARLKPRFLSVHALYTRRGGLDICPWRSSEPLPAPRYRLNRQ